MDGLIALRCDGGSRNGAGHVARCMPIAAALREAGIEVMFLGAFDGLARWLLDRHGMPSADAQEGPCGVDPGAWSGAIVDLYGAGSQALCALAGELPVATIGEADRCASRGLWIDYHLSSPPKRATRVRRTVALM